MVQHEGCYYRKTLENACHEKCNAEAWKKLDSPVLFGRPGALEARAIQRDFEWKRKLKNLKQGISSLNRDLQLVERECKGDGSVSKLNKFDAEAAVQSLESEGRNRWEHQLNPVRPEKFKRLKEALERLTIVSEPALIAGRDDKNEWSSYAKAEEERKAFLEATYNRFRIGAVPEFPCPNLDHFEYEEVEFPLPSGGTVKQPVAHVREPSLLDDLSRKTDSYQSAPNQMNVGTNTDIDDRDAIAGSKRAKSDNKDERSSFVSHLINRTRVKENIPNEGQKVQVSYYGLLFPGTIVKRNLGAGTFTIRFDDNTMNDFPLNSIVWR